ncbi:MAG: hypothetical protein R3272_09705 [Candidatus Promineifilaceae bacterium]|nr:hypothetical protein [Candidatus Promineifilaceae bacterium]
MNVLVLLVSAFLTAAIGFVVIGRKRGATVGALLLGMGLASSLSTFLGEYSIFGYYTNPGDRLALAAVGI